MWISLKFYGKFYIKLALSLPTSEQIFGDIRLSFGHKECWKEIMSPVYADLHTEVQTGQT